MKILAVTYGLPWPLKEGAKIRDYYLLREVARESQVVLASLCKDDRNPPDSPELRQFCEAIETFVPPERKSWRDAASHFRARRPLAAFPFYFDEFASRIHALARRHAVDLVQIEHSFLAPYRTAIPDGCRAVLSLQNIGERQYASMVKLSGSGARSLVKAVCMRQWESTWAKKFDHCIAVSEDDAQWLRERAPHLPTTVIENGVDCDGLRPLPPCDSGNELLFVGGLTYPPNADAVVQFVRHILPVLRRTVPDVRLVVVGTNPSREVQMICREPGVELHADVPDVMPFYRRARACVVPLRAGGGTRLKILEAMALGRPVISTPKGCEGLEVSNGNQLLISPGLPEMATDVARLLADPALAGGLCARAREWVEARHDWRLLGGRLNQLHRQLVACPAETVS